MKPTTIASLRVGDRVRGGTALGVVDKFDRDHVLIRWGERDEPARYTDEGLKQYGIAKVSPFDAEDTIP